MTFSKQKIVVILIWLLLILSVVIFNYFRFDLTSIVPQCHFYRATGYLDPGCGGTRAVQSLLTGNIMASIKYNFLPVLVGGYFSLFFIELTFCTFLNRKTKVFTPRGWMLWVLAFIVVGYGIIRNII